MIKFITEQEVARQPTFGDVEVHQFFVDNRGILSQKMGNTEYATIAMRTGKPFCTYEKGVGFDREVEHILPHVTKIEF